MTLLGRTRRFAIGFFIVYAIAVIYPGVALFRGPRPFIFGLPLAMVWTAAWVVASFFVLLRLDRAYSAAESTYDASPPGPDATRSDAGTAGRTPRPRPRTPER